MVNWSGFGNTSGLLLFQEPGVPFKSRSFRKDSPKKHRQRKRRSSKASEQSKRYLKIKNMSDWRLCRRTRRKNKGIPCVFQVFTTRFCAMRHCRRCGKFQRCPNQKTKYKSFMTRYTGSLPDTKQMRACVCRSFFCSFERTQDCGRFSRCLEEMKKVQDAPGRSSGGIAGNPDF